MCVCVCNQGQGVSLAAHSIYIFIYIYTSKTADTLFNFDQEISLQKKKIEVNELLMRLHVSGFNCENMLK